MITRIGKYELIRPLGAGGMAQTFVAVRRGPAGFEQKVCLKRILPQYTNDTALVEQFLDEAKLLAHLRHANVVQVYEFGEADGSYFMALELIDGADLETVLRFLHAKQRPLPATIALHIVRETLKALHYAHNAQLNGEPLHLVHRDVSPSNIMLSRAGEVKLVDFGIAKSRHRHHQTRAGYTKGKVAYMSPEQARGEQLDGRSDLFAVGIVLHELLTGVHPFDADTDMSVLANLLGGKRPSLAILSPMLRPELVGLIDALLATDPARRPQSAADALVLVPSLDNEFKTERLLEELVTACLVHKGTLAALADTTPLELETLGPVPTAMLSVPAGRDAPEGPKPRSGAPPSFAVVDESTAEMRYPTVETVGADTQHRLQAERSSWARASVAAMAVVMLLLAAWLGLRDRSPRQTAARARSAVPAPLPTAPNQAPEREPHTTYPVAAQPVEPAAPMQAAERVTPDLQERVTLDLPERVAPALPERVAPALPERVRVVAHSSTSDVGTRTRPSRVRRSETHPRKERSARSHDEALPAVTPTPAPSKPAPVAAPAEATPASSSKHRANVQVSGEDF